MHDHPRDVICPAVCPVEVEAFVSQPWLQAGSIPIEGTGIKART